MQGVMPRTMPTSKPKVTVILDELLMGELKHLAEHEYRSLSQMAAVLIREAVEGRQVSQSSKGDRHKDGKTGE